MTAPSGSPAAWSGRRLEHAFVGVSTLLLLARLYASRVLGFGDAEALYATYVAHPAPAYVDHPGLVAVLGAIAGRGAPPSPGAAHLLTAFLATLVPILAWAAARCAGAPRRRAAVAGLVLALCPELAIGLFGLTPDLPLAVLSLACIALGCIAIRAETGSFRGDLALLAAGACAGLGALAKAPGLALVVWLPLIAWQRRPRWLTVSATVLAALITSPVWSYEARHGWPMLAHRFVHTQQAAGFSLRNLGALIGGQLLYVSPFVVAAAWLTGRRLARSWRRDPVSGALAALSITFGVPLVALCLWSRVAEPHWLAPAYLPLLIAWARRPARATFATAVRRPLLPLCAVLVVAVHVYVLTDLFPRFAGQGYVGRYDLANDMRMFPAASTTVRQALDLARLRGPTVVVVAPHWTLAAQLATILPPETRVTTASTEDDDFTRWVTPSEREDAAVVVFVHDDRFAEHAAPECLRGRPIESETRFSLHRGGRVVRTLDVRTYGAARAVGELHPTLAPP